MSKRATATQSKPGKAGKPQAQVQTIGQPPAKKPTQPAEMKAAEEARRQERIARQAENRRVAEQRKRMVRLRNIGIAGAAVIALVAIIAWFAISEANKPGQSYPQMQSPHIGDVTSAHAPYSTDPPTSGPHVTTVPAWGVHDEPIAKELQVHGLEDAGVVINYKPDLDKATVDRLKALVGAYDKEVLLSPYPNLSNPIVLTAWTRMDRLDTFDEARIQKFIKAYKGIDHHKDSGS